MSTTNVHQAKTQLSKLIEAALAGEEVVIARNGVPAVKLVPIVPTPARVPGSWKGLVTVHDPDWWKPDNDLADLFGIGPAGEGAARSDSDEAPP